MFKRYISEVKGVSASRPLVILLMQEGGGVENLKKRADVILERSLKIYFVVWCLPGLLFCMPSACLHKGCIHLI